MNSKVSTSNPCHKLLLLFTAFTSGITGGVANAKLHCDSESLLDCCSTRNWLDKSVQRLEEGNG